MRFPSPSPFAFEPQARAPGSAPQGKILPQGIAAYDESKVGESWTTSSCSWLVGIAASLVHPLAAGSSSPQPGPLPFDSIQQPGSLGIHLIADDDLGPDDPPQVCQSIEETAILR